MVRDDIYFLYYKRLIMLSCDDVKCTRCGRIVDVSDTIVTWDNLIGCSCKVCLKCFDKQLSTVICQTLFESLDDVMKCSKKETSSEKSS